jgi:hypothetical protein
LQIIKRLKIVSKKAFVETIVLTLLAIYFGLLFDETDPLGLHARGSLSIYLYVLIFLSLFYGTVSGLVSLVIFFFFSEYYYDLNSYTVHFSYALLTFFIGEFHFHWRYRLSHQEEENRFLQEKLEEVGRNYFLLKASHEQIEKNYILKPVSIRNSLQQIRELHLESEEALYEELLELLGRIATLEAAAFYLYEEGRHKKVAGVGEEVPFIAGDQLVIRAREDESLTYVSIGEMEESIEQNYLAAIPAFQADGEYKGMLLIKKMSFLGFNKDTLLTFSLFISYFVDHVRVLDAAKPILNKYPDTTPEFVRELFKLNRLYSKFRLESTMVIFKITKSHYAESMSTSIESTLRGLDISFSTNQGDVYLTAVLLPLTDHQGAENFLTRTIERLRTDLGEQELANLSRSVISVKEQPAEELIDLVYRTLYA